jgi:hypothetical protein
MFVNMMAAFLEEKIAKDPWNIALVSVWYFVLTLYAWPLLFVKKTSRTSFHKQEAMKVVNRSSFLFSFLCKERGQGQQSLAIHFGSFYAHSFAISKRCIIESHCSFAAASKPVHQIHRNLQKKSTR